MLKQAPINSYITSGGALEAFVEHLEASELLDGASQISPQVLCSQRDVHLRRCFIA